VGLAALRGAVLRRAEGARRCAHRGQRLSAPLRRNSGRTLHATVWANTTATRGDLLKQLGQVLGFEATTQGRDSVIEETTVPSPRTALGSLDKQSVCAAYPSCK
jgi:hypothetical protein